MKEKEIPSGENCLGLLVVKNRIKMKEHTILPFRQKKRLSFFFFLIILTLASVQGDRHCHSLLVAGL